MRRCTAHTTTSDGAFEAAPHKHNNQIMPTLGCGASARRQRCDDEGRRTIPPQGRGCAMTTGEDTEGEYVAPAIKEDDVGG